MWLIVTVASVILCYVLIAPIYSKWRDTPTFTSINSTNYPVWNMPFPGVTICSNLNIDLEKLKEKLGTSRWVLSRFVPPFVI